MVDTSNTLTALPTRRTALGQLTGSALLTAAPSLLLPAAASAAPRATLPRETLISAWEHAANVDLAPVVKAVGFNTIWTHDKPCDAGTKLEDTLMYRHLQVPGVKYVIAKIERSIWGWTPEQSLAHAEWIAKVSLSEKRIIGVYLNDFYGEIERTRALIQPGDRTGGGQRFKKDDPRDMGGRTPAQWREIIALLRKGNPRLPLWVPCYLPDELNYAFDFDIDAVICGFHFSEFDRKQLSTAEQYLIAGEKKFANKPVLPGLYFNSGPERKPLSEEEFKYLMEIFVRHINEGKTVGLRMFRAGDFVTEPTRVTWAQEALAKLKRR